MADTGGTYDIQHICNLGNIGHICDINSTNSIADINSEINRINRLLECIGRVIPCIEKIGELFDNAKTTQEKQKYLKKMNYSTNIMTQLTAVSEKRLGIPE